MRIGLFTDTYPPFINGVSTSVLMLKQELEKMGHEVYVVTVNNEAFSYKKEDNVLRIPGVPIGIMDFRQSGIYPLRALKIIKKWKLDVIHTHTEFSIGAFARLISKQYNIPLVHTYHTMYEEYIYYITKGYFDSASKKLVEYLTLFLCDKTIDELIVPTKKTKDLFKEKYKVKRDVHVIPSGIDVTRFYKENVKDSEIKELKEELGIKPRDFTMKDLIELTSYNKLDSKIIFVGKVPWDDVPKYYSLCDSFVTASTSETQGLTVIEAMAASKPVVAIKDESFELVIESGKDGILFENEEEYKEALFKLYKDKEFCNSIKQNARKKANLYSAEVYAKSVFEIYEKLMNKLFIMLNMFLKKVVVKNEKVVDM